MIFPLVLLAALVFSAISPRKKGSLKSYCSYSQTQAIKGIFVITIFFSHFCSYVKLNQWYDTPMQEYCIFLGQLMVVPFLFYSGFGIFESVKSKGVNYIKALPKQRILKTLLHFDFAVILFLIFDLIIGRSVGVFDFLLSLTAWESIGNSNWFIFAILCAYTFAFMGLFLFKGKLKHSLIFIIAMSLVYIAIVSRYKASYWFDTILAFPAGSAFSLYKEKFDSFLHNKFIILGSGILCFFVLLFTKHPAFPNSFINSQIALLAFSATIVFLSMLMHINSKILNWFGTNVFGIYILQRIPMNLFSHTHLNEYNIYLFFFISFTCTLILSVLFTKWNDFFDKTFLEQLKT